MPRPNISLIVATLLLALGMLLNIATANNSNRSIFQLSIEGVIGPATEDYVVRSMERALLQQAEFIVIVMDTPGGLDSAMRGIIKSITNTSIPVVTYVAPTGARAASAGTYILYASHIAAMAPGTNVGAATPVQIGGISPPDILKKKRPQDNDDEPEPVEIEDPSKRKLINDAVAYIQSLAQLRGRNQQWAEAAVRKAASLSAEDALKQDVIDIVAHNMVDLFAQLDGREIELQGQKRTLQTTGLTVTQLDPDWRSRLLSVITNPNVAYILLMVGIYGLIFEFSNPGAIVPGTVGAISLLVAMYSLQLLPINYAGMALMLLGVALMIGEAYQPSFGVLGIGGVIAFVIGSVILMDTDVPGYGIDLSVIVTFTVISVLMFVLIIGMAIKSRRRPVVSGIEELTNGYATVVADFDQQGWVLIHSEKWQAVSRSPLQQGQQVRVTSVDGLTLHVEPVDKSAQEDGS